MLTYTIQTEYKAEKANHIEIKNNIPLENIEAVQAERIEIQADRIRQTRISLENTYQEKFDDNIFEEALNTVNNDLSEKALKKSLMKQIEPGKKQQQKYIVDKRKKYI